MRLAKLLGPDLRMTLASEPESLRETLSEFHPEDIAEILDEVPRDDTVRLIQTLQPELAAQVIERLSRDQQSGILSALGAHDATPIVLKMAADDRVDLVQSLPDELASALLKELGEEDAEVVEEIRTLGAWEEGTAGSLMTPEFVTVLPEAKVWEAMEEVRRMSHKGHAETISYVYVAAYGNQLIGVASLRDLILAEPSETMGDVMVEQVVRCAPEDDQEKVAATIAKYDLNAAPVVDERGKLLGVVTVDDVVDVVIEEATEDAQKMGGVIPLEDSYFATGLREFAWKRSLWLVILFGGQLLTAMVMQQHEATLAATMSLVLFIPLIIATGGNSGAQSSTLIIRALAVGEMNPGDWLRVLSREVLIGLAMGCLLGLMGFGAAWLYGEDDPLHLAATVATSIIAIVTLGTLTGSLLPLGIKRIGLDPAVSSTPFIASLVDVLGLVVYFAIAQVVFSLAL